MQIIDELEAKVVRGGADEKPEEDKDIVKLDDKEDASFVSIDDDAIDGVDGAHDKRDYRLPNEGYGNSGDSEGDTIDQDFQPIDYAY